MTENLYIQKIPQAKVLDLRKEVPIEEAQVTSLTLVQRKSLGMTLFSFDKGEGIGGHSAPGDALVQVLTGLAEITIDGEKYQVAAGEAIIMPAGIPHAVHAVEAMQMLLTVVKAEIGE